MFTLIVLALTQYSILFKFLGKRVQVIWDLYRPCQRANLYLAILLLTKVVMGLTHGLLIDYPVAQVSLHLAMQLTIFFLTVWLRKVFNSRLTLSLFLNEYILRIVLIFLILAEILVGLDHPHIIYHLEGLTVNLLFAVTVVSILQLVSAYVNDHDVKNTLCCRSKYQKKNQGASVK